MLQTIVFATAVLAAEPALSTVAVYSAPMPIGELSIPQPSEPAWCFRPCDEVKPSETDEAEAAIRRLLAIVVKLNRPTTEEAMRIAAEAAVIAEQQRVRLAKGKK